MAKDSERERLRKEIDSAYKRVTNKINRTKRNTGAKVAGSEFDPRRDPGAHQRMRSPERMRAYLENLNNFMNRNLQFIAGDKGSPIPRGEFNLYKRDEAAVRAIQTKRDAEIGGIKGPEGFKIKDLQTALPKAGGSSVFGPYKKFDREASDITSAAALRKLRQDLINQQKPEFLHGVLESERDKFKRVSEYLGESASELAELVEGMDDYEFDLFWFGTNSASGIYLMYNLAKEREDANRKEKNQDRTIESKFDDVLPAAKWAKTEGQKKRDADAKAFAEKQANEIKNQWSNFNKGRNKK